LGELRGGASPLFLLLPLPLGKGKGIQGIGLLVIKGEGGGIVFEGAEPLQPSLDKRPV